jgi:hypothetical protein
MSRKNTNYLFDLMESGLVSAETVAMLALQYMSEDDVTEMMRVNDLLINEDEEFGDYDESMDGDFDSGMASAGFGTDEDYGYYGEE